MAPNAAGPGNSSRRERSTSCACCTAPEACHGDTCSAVLYVDQSAKGNNDGSSWQNAFTTIDAAIVVAKPSWQIWVAKGHYTIGAPGSQAVVAMPAGVAMYGHFKGTEAGLADRDLTSSNDTVLDGQSGARVVIGASNAVLDGFTLQNGSALQGAGLYASGVTALTISNCRISGGKSSGSGAGIYAVGSNLVIESSVVASNQAPGTAFGGGIDLESTTATIDHCEISQNVGGTGGGLYANASKLTVTNTLFDSNQAIYSQSGGGGAFIQSTSGQFTSSVFAKNAATQAFGGGLYDENASPHVVNCTFWGNTVGLNGLDVFDNLGSKPLIVNSILWSAGSASVLYDYSGSGPAQVSFSDVRGGWSGTGNINADPALVGPAQGNFQLTKGSPCIDAADGNSAPATDAAGQPRFDDPTVPNTGTGAVPYADIGAYEYQGK